MDEISLPTLHCFRCGHEWYPRNPRLPKICPICKRTNWNVPEIGVSDTPTPDYYKNIKLPKEDDEQ